MSADADLDSLFRSARAVAHIERKAKAAAALAAPPADPNALYTNPDNWTRTRGVALIHTDTQTLLGQFSEYVHRSVAGCRKLLREHSPISVEATEEVSGSWWLGDQRIVEPRQEWHEKRPAIIHLHLDSLRVHSPACEVIVHLSYGGIARVDLAMDTQFAQEQGKEEQLLFIPAGTDVLKMMSLDSKIALRVELGK